MLIPTPRRTMPIQLGFLCALIAAPLLAAQAPAHLPLQSRDVFDLETASDAQISPDGRYIVYVRNNNDIMTDSVRQSLWLIDVQSGEQQALQADGHDNFSPRWSPDGRRIAFVSTADGKPQLYMRWLDSGRTSMLTNLTAGPGDLTFSPDGRWLAFSQFVPKSVEPLAKAPEKPEGATWAPEVTLVDSVVYRVDGQGYLKHGYRHLFLVAADGGAARQLTTGNFNHGGRMSFTPDGKRLIFSANRNDDWEYDNVESEIYAIDIASGEIAALTHRKGPDATPAVSPDGRSIAYVGFDDREQGYQVTHLYVMASAGGEPRTLAATLDRDVNDPRWASDGRGIYYSYDDHGVRRIAYVGLNGRQREIVGGLGGEDIGRPYSGGEFSVADNGRIAYTATSITRPPDVAMVEPSGRQRRLTHLNSQLDYRALSDGERIEWQSSHDGRTIEGWLMKPAAFDPQRKYPLLLEIHGGPFASYGPAFSIEMQRYAAQGYFVLYCNPRGSTSYGEEFGNLIHHAYPGFDYDDLMSGVDAVMARGNIDADNLFVTGGSGGGVLTAWIVGKTSRFRAAVVAKPVINWTSFVLTADFNNFFYRYWFAAPPWEDQAAYWQRSPLSLVGNVTTPTMLLTGEADYRTPMSETEQFYQALKLRKVPTAMLRVPEASHGLTARPSNQIAKVDNIIAWFEKFRHGKAEAPGT
ncbi:MAG: S9 family peptidase [Steroidobacteraceae bacterium]